MNEIKLNEIEVRNNKIIYDYTINGDWSVYFNESIKMEVEYSVDIDRNTPKSLLAVPFVCNIIPIVWLCDAVLYLEEIDKDFFENLDLVRDGYCKMYPMLSFHGSLKAKKVVDNKTFEKSASAVFFSGGVDAYTTLLRHIEKQPYLITLWGSDVKLEDSEGWSNVEKHIQSVSDVYGLEHVIIRTNFRSVICERNLDELVKKSADGWWHGFQHGIAIIGHAAPLTLALGLKSVYIASSFPEAMKGEYTCASDPTIDNFVTYAGCRTIHDGYELDRQGKIQFLLSKQNERYPISLRVCWISTGGKNCCRCEKCYRTILEILSEGKDPNDYGFVWDDESIHMCKRDMLCKITTAQFIIEQFYYPIQEQFVLNKDKIANYEKYEWLVNMNFDNFNDYPIKVLKRSIFGKVVLKIYRKIRKGIKK